MEIQRSNQDILNIVLVLDRLTGSDDITPFMSSLPKIQKELNKAGFRNAFTPEEKNIWAKILGGLNQLNAPNEAPKN